jgi:hypothetical protein
MDVYVFARGSDNKTTWYRTLTNPIWAPIGGIATSAPDATPNAAEPRISVVVRGADESLYCTDFNTTLKTWSPWADYGGTII